MTIPDQFNHALIRVNYDTTQRAIRAFAEIHAMTVSARRSMGQVIRYRAEECRRVAR